MNEYWKALHPDETAEWVESPDARPVVVSQDEWKKICYALGQTYANSAPDESKNLTMKIVKQLFPKD